MHNKQRIFDYILVAVVIGLVALFVILVRDASAGGMEEPYDPDPTPTVEVTPSEPTEIIELDEAASSLPPEVIISIEEYIKFLEIEELDPEDTIIDLGVDLDCTLIEFKDDDRCLGQPSIPILFPNTTGDTNKDPSPRIIRGQ